MTLSSALKAGDTISIVGGAELGSSGDKRAVGGASRTVAAPAPDRARPTLSVILIADETEADITTSEEAVTALAEGATVELRSADTTKTVTVVDLDLTFDPALAAGDRITISSGAVADGAGNKSLQRSFTAIKEQASPRITSVLMSSLNHSDQATTAVPTALTGGNGEVPIANDATDATEDIWLVAKSDGAAAGAVGNLWSVTFDRASTYDADKDLDIDVRVNSRDQSVFVRFNNGKAKFADLTAALESNSAFDALFEVKVDALASSTTGGACGKAANKDLLIPTLVRGDATSTAQLADGVTKAAIQITFNAYVKAVMHANLLVDVLEDTLPRYRQSLGDSSIGIDAVLQGLGLGESDLVTSASITEAFPGTKVTYSMTTGQAAALPQPRDLVVTTSVADVDDDTTADFNETTAVATGYAANEDSPSADDGENVDVNKNGPSQVRISRSSGVDAPK